MARINYTGSYMVEITSESDRVLQMLIDLGISVDMDKRRIIVESGGVLQSIGGFDFYSGSQIFSIGYAWIREISNGNGEILWKNSHE